MHTHTQIKVHGDDEVAAEVFRKLNERIYTNIKQFSSEWKKLDNEENDHKPSISWFRWRTTYCEDIFYLWLEAAAGGDTASALFGRTFNNM